MVDDNRHRKMTYKVVPMHRQPLDKVMSALAISGFVPDDEFAADLELLVSGKMSPEEHRAYLKQKYARDAA